MPTRAPSRRGRREQIAEPRLEGAELRATAAGLRTRVRQRGVSVEQSLRKTTGLRPDYGRLQQGYGDQALEDKRGDVVEKYEDGMDRVVDHFSR